MDNSKEQKKKKRFDVARITDGLGIIFFLLLFLYFYNVPKRGLVENLLMVASGGAFVLDSIFMYGFLTNKF